MAPIAFGSILGKGNKIMATDDLGAAIIKAELAPSDFLLDLNGSLSVPNGFPLPPRGICLPGFSGSPSR
jgi:hypothetical protein